MTKEELVWVLIRGTGFLLLLKAVLYVPEIISAGVALWYLGDPMGSEGARMAIEGQRNQLVSATLYLLIHGAIGLYFLRGAAWVHRLLSFSGRERSNSTVERDARKSGARPSP